MSKSILIIQNTVEDITNFVETVKALNPETDEVVYSGCGIRLFRSNHIHGDAIIFLSFEGEKMIFGEWVKVYSPAIRWRSSDYLRYKMSCTKKQGAIFNLNGLSKLSIV